MDAVINMPYFQTISNIEVSAYPIVAIPTRKSCICTSNIPCVYEIQVNEILASQNPMLHLL